MVVEKLTDGTEVDGTSLQVSIEITYAELADTFGEPSHISQAGEKTQVEWWLLFADGTIATIYDWKMYGVPVEDVTTWNIGGKDMDAEYQVTQAIMETRDISVGTLFDA